MDIEQIAAELRQQLETWLNTPDEASRGLEALRERLQALGATIGTGAKRDALKALAGSEKDIQRSRQRQAADCLAAAVRPLGVVLVAQAPPKRMRKAKAGAPAPATQGSPSPSDPRETVEPSAEATPGDGGGLRSMLRRAGGGA